jgi:hypothetical protein
MATTDIELKLENAREICDFIVKVRMQKGLTQRQMGTLLDCSQSMAARLEAYNYINNTARWRFPDERTWGLVKAIGEMTDSEAQKMLKAKYDEPVLRRKELDEAGVSRVIGGKRQLVVPPPPTAGLEQLRPIENERRRIPTQKVTFDLTPVPFVELVNEIKRRGFDEVTVRSTVTPKSAMRFDTPPEPVVKAEDEKPQRRKPLRPFGHRRLNTNGKLQGQRGQARR